MIAAGKLYDLTRRAEALRQRQAELDERATRHGAATRAGAWDSTLHTEIETGYDQLGQELAQLQADLDLLLAEDGADD